MVMQRLDLKAFIRQLAEESVPELTKADMIYEIEDVADELWIEASPKELVRAYENLITNAIRYGRSGGKLEIGFSKRKMMLWSVLATSERGLRKVISLLFLNDSIGQKSRVHSIQAAQGLDLRLPKVSSNATMALFM